MIHQLLEIRLLGPVEIKFEGKIININRRIERAILYILAIEHKPVSRERLIDLIWSEANQTDPRAALRTALSRLRNELPDKDLILTKLDLVWLDSDRCYVDLVDFENQIQHLQNLLSAHQSIRTLPGSIVNQIQKVLDLWPDNNIIVGDDFRNYPGIEAWCQSVNNKLNHKRKFLIKRLAEHSQISGQLEKALTLFMQLTHIDHSDVSSQCAALDILINMGRRQDAINYCDTLEIIYEREFYASLPDEIIARCQSSQYINNANHYTEQNQWTIPLSMQLELIGRQKELNQMQQAFYKGGMISLQGEMGSGKTRLVQELYRTLSQKPILLLAPSREMETNLPFSPIIHCLRHSLPADIWKEVDPIWIERLQLLLPELSKHLAGNQHLPLSRLPTGNQQLYDALLNICKHLFEKYGRILFFLDDAHWTDIQTLQALSYLMSSGFFAKYGLLVIASRSEEKNNTLDQFINQSFHSNNVQVINLQGLYPYELLSLAEQVVDEPPKNSFIDRLYQETNGNPYLALEIIRSILESHDSLESYDESSSLPLPLNIYALMQSRLLRLDKTSSQILLSAAVLGDNCYYDVLATIANVPSSSFSELLIPLIESGFVYSTQKDRRNRNHLHFTHEKMREVVLKEATEVQLQSLHRQVAQLMVEDLDFIDKPSIVANHFLLADDSTNAFDWFLKSADHAWILGSKEETQYAYQQAEKLLTNAPEGFFKPRDTLQLYQQWGEFAYQSNQSELLEQLGVKLQYLGDSAKNPKLVGASKILIANACFLRLEYETALKLIHSAIENFKTVNDKEWLITAIKRRGVLNWWTMNFPGVEESAKEMLDLINSTTLDDDFRKTMEFNAKYLTCYLYYSTGEAKLTNSVAAELYKDYFSSLRPIDKLKSLYILGFSHLLAGKYESCENFCRQALEVANLLENVITGESVLLCLSQAEFIQGKLDQAYQHAFDALKSAEKGKRKINVVTANCLLGDIFRILQDYKTASQYYGVGQIREGFSNLSIEGIKINTHLAQMFAWTNQISEAKELLQRNLGLIEEYGLAHHHTQALLAYGICYLNEGSLSQAEDKFIQGLKIAEEKGLTYECVTHKLGLVLLMIAKHEIHEAQKLLSEILNTSQSRNMVWPTLNGLRFSIKLYTDTNQPEMVHETQMIYDQLLKKIEENVNSEPLKQAFINAKQNWG